MATATLVLTRIRVGNGLWTVLRIVLVLAALALVAYPLIFGGDVWAQRISRGAIYAIIGLSINTLTGHAGQISLGHQAFVGIGAFAAAFMASRLGAPLGFGLGAAALVGAITAAIVGMVALRVSGLYLALVTLAFGMTAETTIFNWREFTGGGAGASAPRPAIVESDFSYALLCLGVLALVLYADWRMVATKTGRALAAVRNNEQIAATLGVNVTGYKLAAFCFSGLAAGLAGGLFAHWNQVVQALDFEFQVALVWVLMTVVGGLRSRLGVIIASAFFALLPLTLPNFLASLPWQPPFLNEAVYHVLPPFIVVVLLLIVLRFFPGGLGQLLAPLTRRTAHKNGDRG
ncbi:branched-chain amino acid ABC transporter permease [Glycomyces buryatensis]|uniref:Branched-chain amino acid ABC transporter permease n=1 Tax=Glycomyces buryatensis TaxID=2570927 RepID=A0A4S8Q7N3_9ACTN|nr:branched-chain amino acid ABC transporter permease [Glycomyces buryatensis]THV38695.1 branched-chain amino acid ABC transporter permease [Glycomyces buryatensis]